MFLESSLNFEHFEKNEPPSLSISEIIDSKIGAYLVLFVKTVQ